MPTCRFEIAVRIPLIIYNVDKKRTRAWNLKQIGNTGTMVPEIGLGTWNYNGGVEPLRKGIELGASLIDTAEGYYTEDVVGKSY